MLAIAPAQWGQQHHCDNGKDACVLTMAMMPLWQGQQHQLDNGNNAIALPLQQGQQHYPKDSKDAWFAKMPAHQQWLHHCNKGNDTSLMTGKRLCIDDGNETIVTRAMTTAWWLC
jgi:hypothetical protein